jgi:hypothetical protein
MKVPTYESKAAIPTQGRGLFLTAQLNAGAMMAPGLANERQGQQLAQGGEQLAAWGFKKAQISAESEALTAATKMQVQLAQISEDALRSQNIEAGAEQFRSKSKLATKEYGSTMSNKLARTAFASQALKLKTRAMIDFNKANNKRVVAANIANVNETVTQEERVSSDINASPAARGAAYNNSLSIIETARVDLGEEDYAKRVNEINENAARDTLTAYISQPGANVLSIVKSFRQGTLDDFVIKSASKNLSVEQIAKIADGGVQRANRIIKLRTSQRKDEEKQASVVNNEIYMSIVNTDYTDVSAVQMAEENFNILKWSNYFKTPAQLAAVEALFDEDVPGIFSKQSDKTDRVESELSYAAAINTLTYDMLLAAKAEGTITREFYNQQIVSLETEFGQSRNAAIKEFNIAFKYSELADKGGPLQALSRQSFYKASRLLNQWAEKNKTASRADVLEKGESIVEGLLEKFKAGMEARRLQVLIAAHSRLRDQGEIPAPTKDNFEEFKRAVSKRMAKAAKAKQSDLGVTALNKIINDEVSFRILD